MQVKKIDRQAEVCSLQKSFEGNIGFANQDQEFEASLSDLRNTYEDTFTETDQIFSLLLRHNF